MPDLGLTHVALPVTDLAASCDFYARYAGMRAVHERAGAAWLSDGTRPFIVVLLELPAIEHPLAPMAHLGVACESRADVERLSDLAREEGVLIGGPNDSGPPVGYWAFLRDPDGHTLELSHGQEVAVAVAESTPADD